ncbi:hypothetical protein BDN70DRAFT_898994 [Pholiota conissans]|uniref:Uncharacterized protein n=1 Tax=Pholiota conissans TaxID=109636 RepID=A0A9P6CV22_9AGAR|nr:hypothetical protein BDN70DRAFT_898994 [Pholiota conissans]
MESSLLKRTVAPLKNYLEPSLGRSPSEIAHLLPFQQESPDDLQHELWSGGGRTWDIRLDEWPGLRRRAPSYLTIWWIYGLLHPIDLYHAICSTKRLRRFLLDKKSSFIWKESFLNYPVIPFYPDDVSAPKWASLLFGPATCDSCGMSDFLGEYVLRRKSCGTCDSYHLEDKHVLSNAICPIVGEFRYQRDDIWKMATKIQRYLFTMPRLEIFTFYSLNHILELAENMRVHLLEIKSGTPDSRAKAEKALQKRGYNTVEVKTVISSFCKIISPEYEHRDAVSDPWLTKSKVSKYLPILEGFIYEARREDRRRRLILPRRNQVDVCYNRITEKLLSPREMRYIPFSDIIYKVGYFHDYINNPQDEVAELDYEIAEPEIQGFLDTYLTTKRYRFFKLMQDKGFLSEKVYEDSDIDQAFKLAIAVFECCGKLFVGFDEARLHLCDTSKLHMQDVSDDSFKFCVSDAGYRALENIVEILVSFHFS